MNTLRKITFRRKLHADIDDANYQELIAEREGYFHELVHKSMQRKDGSYYEETFALVENTDGTMEEIPPTNLKFTAPPVLS